MKANELRIGNYVLRNGNQFQAIRNTIADCDLYPHYYEPIPLTKEWIINLGFEKDNHDFEIYHDFNRYILHNGFRDNFQMGIQLDAITMYFSWNIKYVHQLQNLYFALTGEELTLKN